MNVKINYLFPLILVFTSSAFADITVHDFPDEVTADNYEEVGNLLNQWVEIESSEKGQLFILPSSMTNDEFDNKTVWLKAVNTIPVDGVKTFKTLYVFDCETQKQGIAHVIEYDKNGNEVTNHSRSSVLAATNTADPDGFSYGLMQSMCR